MTDSTEPDDDIDLEELEEQEWTLVGSEEGTIEFGGMTFAVEEPDDEEILNMMVGAQTGEDDLDGADRMFKLVQSAVKKPEVTPERWRDMNTGQRLGLAFKIAEFAGIDQMMDFPEAGPSPQQDS